jgi:hypothetical protein
VEDAWLERKKFRIKLKEADSWLSSQIADLRAQRKVLEIADDYQDTDMKELTKGKWDLI